MLLTRRFAAAVISVCLLVAPVTYFAWQHFYNVPTQLMIPGLEEPLLATGKPSREETRAVQQAIDAYMKNPSAIDNTSLTNFLKQYPDSVWYVALQTNLGLMYYRSGAFSLAINAWEDAWQRGSRVADTTAKALIDRAYGELVRMHARLGHTERLSQLLEEGKDRPLMGQATEAVAGAKQGLWLMRNNPGTAYLCGPMALKNVLIAKNFDSNRIEFLNAARSGDHGVSLNEVDQLAQKVGLDYTMAYREDSSVPLPLPVVVHWKVNHYAAVVSEKNGIYHVKDPTFGNDLSISKAVLDQETDNYFMIPKTALGKGWREVALAEASNIYGMGTTTLVEPDGTGACDEKISTGCDQNPTAPWQDWFAGWFNGIVGMPHYDVHASLVSVNVTDTPVGYTPPKGPSVYTTLTYNQREASQPSTFSFSNVGPKWMLNWTAYVVDHPLYPGEEVAVHTSGGGRKTYGAGSYNATTHKFTPDRRGGGGAVLEFVSSSAGYKRYLTDGSVEEYSVSDNATTYPRRFFLSSFTDAQGNTITLSYDALKRLTTVTDALGQQTTFSYQNTNPSIPLATRQLLVTQITDPFGRTATIGYNSAGKLTQITDAENMASSFTWETGWDYIDSMTTPYGTTQFIRDDSSFDVHRLTITFCPQGGGACDTERVESKVTQFVPADSPPSGMSNIDSIALSNLTHRNTFSWDRRTYKLFGADYTKADIRHWVHASTADYAAGVLESIKRPLESRVWFTYPGQTSSAGLGTQDYPNAIGRVLDDGSSQVTKLERNSLGKVTREIGPTGTERVYGYASNEVDLLTIDEKDTTGTYVRLATYTYDSTSRHSPKTYTDGRGNQAIYTYNSAGQLLTSTQVRTPPNVSLTTTYQYDSNGFLSSVTDPNNVVTHAYTYDAVGRVRTSTNAKGYTLTYDYDNLNRVTRVTYPDATFHEYVYDKLDVVTERDQLGNVKELTHDAVRNLTRVRLIDSASTSASFRVDYAYHENGLLKSITNRSPTNADGDVYTIGLDDESRVKTTTLGATSTTYNYETTTKRVKNTVDAAGGVTQYEYDKADRVTKVTDPRGVATSYAYNILGQKTSEVSRDRGTTTFNLYDVLGQLTRKTLANGQVINYTYDGLNRLKTITYANASEDNVTFTYDDTSNGNYGIGRLTGMVKGPSNDSAKQITTLYQYDEMGNVVMQATQVGTRTPDVVRYAYNAAGSLTQIAYPSGRLVNYYRDTAQRVITVTMQNDANSAEQTVASNMTYKPFGPLTGLTFGNNEKLIKTFDRNYRLARLATAHPEDPEALIPTDVVDHDLSYGFSPTSNITQITDNLETGNLYFQRYFTYDVLDRLKRANFRDRYFENTYDAGGNRTAENRYADDTYSSDAVDTNTFVVENTNNHQSNQLQSSELTIGVTSTPYPQETYAHNESGNIIKKVREFDEGFSTPRKYFVTTNYIYSANNRLKTTYSDFLLNFYGKGKQNPQKLCTANAHKRLVTYDYNGKGERVLKKGEGTGNVELQDWGRIIPETLFNYSLSGELLSESDSEGSYTDYIYVGGQLLAMYQKHNVNGYTGSQISTSVDNTDATTSQTGVWASTTSNQQCFNGADYLLSDISGNNTFTWPLDLSGSNFGEGDYYVFASWGAHSAYSDKARYTVHTGSGDHEFTVDQRYDAIDYDTGITYSKFMWGYLGKIHFSGTGGEYIKLDDATSGGKPVSADGVRIIKVRPPSFTEDLFYIQNDHLGQPQRVFDQNRAVVWQGVFNAWGSDGGNSFYTGNGDITPVLNLRFPGQYYDQETGLHYNYFRDYDPQTGRYLQSDPIGLKGGLNTYAYVGGNPVNFFDQFGLEVTRVCRPVQDWKAPGAVHCSVFVWHWEEKCGKQIKVIDSQYSVAGGQTPQTNPNLTTYAMDREGFYPGGSGIGATSFDLPPPSGMSQSEWDAAVTSSGNNYNSGEPYNAWRGPNSNTAYDNIIEGAGGVAPDVPGAYNQNYGESKPIPWVFPGI